MNQFVFKMPDLGEGTVAAEIVAWHAKPGDEVTEDQLIVEVMTDKAAVEVPAPVSGRVLSISGSPGDKIAVGSPLIVFDIGEASAAPLGTSATPLRTGRVMASPADRRRAREAGLDLTTVAGSGPGGRIVRYDVDSAVAQLLLKRDRLAHAPAAHGGEADDADPVHPEIPATTEIKIIGLRRVIAERMSEAKRNIPHFAYVEEVDVTELESLRTHLNAGRLKDAVSMSLLPLVVSALTRVLESFPQCNVLHDAARGVLVRHRAVHVGIATQTADGLKVPVVRDAQNLSVWEIAEEIRRLAAGARSNKATREELTGSTITVTSLGKLGGIVSTPIINAPEVAIIGLNKAVERPVVHQGAIVVRRIMNLSSSFDHRFVDGYDAAAMIQALKQMLEHPAMIFIPKVKAQ